MWVTAVFPGCRRASTDGGGGHRPHQPQRLWARQEDHGQDLLFWGIFLVVAVVTAVTGREIISLILAGGALVWIVRTPPAVFRRRGTVAEAGSAILLLKILGFFAYAGSFVFGSGLAIVPFLHGGVVLQHHWLMERQFLDAVAVLPLLWRTGG